MPPIPLSSIISLFPLYNKALFKALVPFASTPRPGSNISFPTISQLSVPHSAAHFSNPEGGSSKFF
jgi:hypothetical protein